MLYGGCHSSVNFNTDGYKPALLYIAGSEDQLVKASTCLERKNDPFAPTKDLDVMVIDGACHLFDGDQSATFTHRKWGTVTVRAAAAATSQARLRVIALLKRVFK